MQIINEHYHIYNRGARKAPIFLDASDYERFLQLLYVSNDKPRGTRTRRVDLREPFPETPFE